MLQDGDRIVVVGSQISASNLLEGGVARVWGLLDGGSRWERYPAEDYSLFGIYTSTVVPAEMASVTVLAHRIIAVGWYYTDAGVWIGTWTD